MKKFDKIADIIHHLKRAPLNILTAPTLAILLDCRIRDIVKGVPKYHNDGQQSYRIDIYEIGGFDHLKLSYDL